MKEKTQVFAIIRIDHDHGDTPISDKLAVTSILPTIEEAQQEVERLKEINPDSQYLWLCTRYYPNGRGNNGGS